MKCIESKNIHLFRITVWMDMEEWHVAWDNFCNINSVVYIYNSDYCIYTCLF